MTERSEGVFGGDDADGRDIDQNLSPGRVSPSMETLISQQAFFKGLTPSQIQKLAESALLMDFTKDQWIVQEGEPANRFYIILEGTVLMESENQNGGGLAIQTLGPGDDLGWSWLFLPYYVHFSARAAGPVRTIFFYGTRLREQCESDHHLGYELMKRIAQVVIERLEHLREQLLATTVPKK